MPGVAIKNIAGKRFGKLVAKYPIGRSERGYATWHCACDCGGSIVLPLNRITDDRCTPRCDRCRESLIPIGTIINARKVIGREAGHYVVECKRGHKARAHKGTIGGMCNACISERAESKRERLVQLLIKVAGMAPTAARDRVCSISRQRRWELLRKLEDRASGGE